MLIENEFMDEKRRIAKYLKETAAKEGLKVEVRFVNKKIIPRTLPKTVYFSKKRILEFPNRILNELDEDEIKAIGVHEIGHLVRKRWLFRLVNIVIVAATIGLIEFLFIIYCLDLKSVLLFLSIVLVIWSANWVSHYSVRRFEHDADKYAKNMIGGDITINALRELYEWVEKQKEFNRQKMIQWLLFPDHPSPNSRLKRLEKDC